MINPILDLVIMNATFVLKWNIWHELNTAWTRDVTSKFDVPIERHLSFCNSVLKYWHERNILKI